MVTTRALRCAIAVATGLSAAGAASAADPVSFNLASIPTAQVAHYYVGQARGLYKAAGMDVTIRRGPGSGEAVRTVASGASTSFSLNYFYQRRNVEQAGKKLKVIPYADYGFEIYSLCVIASESTTQKNPDLVKRFLAATKQALEWTVENPKGAAEIYHKEFPLSNVEDDKDEIAAMGKFVFNDYGKRTGFGFEDERLKKTYEIVAKARDLDVNASPRVAIDTSLAPK